MQQPGKPMSRCLTCFETNSNHQVLRLEYRRIQPLLILWMILLLPAPALIAQFAQPHPSLPPFHPMSQQQLQRTIGSLGLTQDEWASLAQYGATVRINSSASSGDLNPAQLVQRLIEQRIDRNKANVGIETLMIMPIPAYIRTLSPDQQVLVLYNRLHRFSTMAGINYWSESRQQFRQFYTLSNLVDPQTRRTPLPDPQFTQVPPQSTLILRQIDTSFGDNLFRVQVNQFSQPKGQGQSMPGIHLSLTNETSMRQGIITLARPEEIAIDLIISIQDGFFLFYGTTDLSVPRVFGLRDRASASFYHRLMALYRWFYDQIQE
jgi:hypothetical protein